MLRLNVLGSEKEMSLTLEEVEILEQVKAGEETFDDSLGWVHLSEWAGERVLRRTEELAAHIREKADVFVLIGVGGSNNAARSVIKALEPQGGPEILYAGNTLSPHEIGRILEKLKGRSIYINCIAKNFETLEPGAAFRVMRHVLLQQYGKKSAAERIICTGTTGSRLEELCIEEGYEFLSFPDNIGGRFTAFSYVGLLPMAVAGIDIRQLVHGGEDMQMRLFEESAEDHIALRYAVLRNQFYRNGRRLEMLTSFEPRFRWFYKWWEQLFAESEGKDGRGLFPVTGEFSEELHSLGQYMQDGTPLMFETFLEVTGEEEDLSFPESEIEDGFDYLLHKGFREMNQRALEATRKAHSQKMPCLTLEIERLDAYHFGQLFYFFQFSCYLSARILGVNPFDQPGVEAYKNRMFQALGKESSDGKK